jgi:uncharacterized membrane protein HdeD (DUF308 family)
METELERRVPGALAERWWTFVVRGLAAIVLGILAFARPGMALEVLVLLWGAFALVDGVFTLVAAALRGRAGLRWGWWFFEGIAGIAAGVLAFLWPGVTAVALVAVVGVWAVVTGIAQIAAAIGLRRLISREWLLALGGVASVVFGLLVLVNPLAGGLSIVWVIGTYAIVFGVLLCSLGFRLYRLRPGGERPIPAGGLATPA